MPQNIMCALCAAKLVDHFKFAYYSPEMCLQVKKKLPTFNALVKLSIYKLCVLYLPTHKYLRMRLNIKLVYG